MKLGRYETLIRIPSQLAGRPLVLNVKRAHFSTVRNGDLIGVMNVVAHLRLRENNPGIRFHVTDEALNNVPYCKDFRDLMLKQTDYLSETPGQLDLPITYTSVWHYRGAVGDYVSIPNPEATQKKVVVFPVLDAPYNLYRNWPMPVFQEIIDQIAEDPRYRDHEKILCAQRSQPNLRMNGFVLSTDFMTNVRHLMSAELYVGGDTGMSHLAGALDRGPHPVYWCHGAEGRIHTLPFHFTRKGECVMF